MGEGMIADDPRVEGRGRCARVGVALVPWRPPPLSQRVALLARFQRQMIGIKRFVPLPAQLFVQGLCRAIVDGDGNPDLCLDRILGGAEEGLDPQVLFDPFEKQFDLPAATIQVGPPGAGEGPCPPSANPPPFG